MTRYFLASALSAIGFFALLWAWAFFVPMAYLDPEYPYWRAKLDLMGQCDLGEVVILGDSRAAADIVPVLLPVKATNLAVGGGKPIEALAALRRVLACPTPPKRVVLSFDAGHFMKPDLFWERSVRFGFVGPADLEALIAVSSDLDDWSVWNANRADGLPPSWRAALHAARFPTVVFGNLLQGVVFMRWWGNTDRLAEGLRSLGHYPFGTASGSDGIGLEAGLDRYRPSPVLDRYFHDILRLLAERGIAADFIAMPMNEATRARVKPALHEGFTAWLNAIAARDSNFQVVGTAMPSWPNRYFGDAFSHLNGEGAIALSHWLSDCLTNRFDGRPCTEPSPHPRLQAAPPKTQNDAQYEWFKATGRDASDSVPPSSKRRS